MTEYTPRKPVAGWVVFECDECGQAWEENTRDCLSPSGTNCGLCFSWQHPVSHHADPSLPVDKAANLTCAYQSNILRPGSMPPEPDNAETRE